MTIYPSTALPLAVEKHNRTIEEGPIWRFEGCHHTASIWVAISDYDEVRGGTIYCPVCGLKHEPAFVVWDDEEQVSLNMDWEQNNNRRHS
jgi:hypothetical protein